MGERSDIDWSKEFWVFRCPKCECPYFTSRGKDHSIGECKKCKFQWYRSQDSRVFLRPYKEYGKGLIPVAQKVVGRCKKCGEKCDYCD